MVCPLESSGEAGSAPVEVAQEGREDLKAILEEYDPDNVFNLDEAGLFYLMLPDRSIMACKSEKGTKRAKSESCCRFHCEYDWHYETSRLRDRKIEASTMFW